jgi:hypothetical protein
MEPAPRTPRRHPDPEKTGNTNSASAHYPQAQSDPGVGPIQARCVKSMGAHGSPGRPHPARVLSPGDRAFLHRRVDDLERAVRRVAVPIRSWADQQRRHPGNLLADPTSPHGHVLTDWPGACGGDHARCPVRLPRRVGTTRRPCRSVVQTPPRPQLLDPVEGRSQAWAGHLRRATQHPARHSIPHHTGRTRPPAPTGGGAGAWETPRRVASLRPRPHAVAEPGRGNTASTISVPFTGGVTSRWPPPTTTRHGIP